MVEDGADATSIASDVERLRPSLVLHGHHHVGYSGMRDSVRLEGFASDSEAHSSALRSWAILSLPSLTIEEPWRVP